MITALPALYLLSLAPGLSQSPQTVDEVRALARDGPDSILADRARRRPDDAREALRRLLAGAAGGASDSARASSLAAAERLAAAYTLAWGDSFLVRQVARFRSLSPA